MSSAQVSSTPLSSAQVSSAQVTSEKEAATSSTGAARVREKGTGFVLSWKFLLLVLIGIIMIVPARRYALPIPSAFALEPYRVAVALIVALIVVAMLTDRGFRWQRLTFGGLVVFYLVTQVISIGVNVPGLVDEGLAENAVSSLGSVVLISAVFFVVRMLSTSESVIDSVVSFTVVVGAFIGACVALERVTRVNVFILFANSLPFLQATSLEESEFIKQGTARAFGSAQHPIALAVFLCMLIPLAIYQSRHARWPVQLANRQLFWLGCTLCLGVGMISAVSRTGFVMLGVMTIIFIMMRPSAISRLLVFGIPALALAFVVSPRNMLSMLRELTNPSALIESQLTAPGMTGSGRLADLGPSLQQASVHPIFGTGLGSRITTGRQANAFILDNQLLSTLLESGILGVIGVIAMILVPGIRLLALARRTNAAERGLSDRQRDLALATGIGIIGYFVALFFLDAFLFIQTFLAFFLLLGIGSWAASQQTRYRAVPASVQAIPVGAK
ncbi:O-antigen ligase family protein [Salinibacterium sp. SYSU T00001]|uniref:O-antigen ligase family protein n=1 Tax=Homoserinimonas sedimenticola TaxID=2986805 RepID=UPI002236B31D|nr:O-antigen ligase family protein [Salinibacterium sedimenticola]MCW4384764.1 O-antigen ligase family protein [Salinibacterium sedimenticola]